MGLGSPSCMSCAPLSGFLSLKQLRKGHNTSGGKAALESRGVMVAAAQEDGLEAPGLACVQTEGFRELCGEDTSERAAVTGVGSRAE